MKKAVFLLFLISLSSTAQGPAVKFLEKSHEFGNISEKGPAAQTTFRFVNTGDAPLVILYAKTSCGCTKATYPEAPVAPGDTARIDVKFDQTGYAGEFNKTITVRSNATSNATTRLKIKGCVIPTHH